MTNRKRVAPGPKGARSWHWTHKADIEGEVHPRAAELTEVAPPWWSWRDRLAARWGRRFWPAFYIAPRATRDRWANVAALMQMVDEGDQAVTVARFLEDVGELPPGSADALERAAERWSK